MSFLKKTFLLFSFIGFVFPTIVFASEEISVSPPIISEKTDSPGILEYDLTVRNDSDGKRDLYVIVRDVVEGGEKKYDDPSELPMLSSPTRWVSVERGVIELFPGDEKNIPLKINIPSEVEPGFYHAAITFARGSNRPQAEKAADQKNESKLILNLEVEKHEVELAEVSDFSAGGSIITGSKVDFTANIKNIGNKEVIPEGEIIIYDKGGRIVESLNAAEVRETIYPGGSQLYEIPWKSGRSFGKFKAKLMMYYGNDQKVLQDITTFVLMPVPLLVILGLFIVVIVAMFSYFLLRKNITGENYEEMIPEEQSGMVLSEVPAETEASPPPQGQNGNYVIDLKSRR